MDGWMFFALILGAISLASGGLAIDAWLRSDSSFLKGAWAAYKAWYQEYADYLFDRTPAKSYAIQHAAIAGSALLVGIFAVGQPFIVAGMLAVGLMVPVRMLRDRALKRRMELIQQIDGALQLMANSLQVTPSVEAALLLIAQHMKPPLSQEVRRVVAAFRMGQSLDDALQSMADRCNDPFVTAMVIALIVGRRTGGNIASTLRQIASTTREAVRVEKDMGSKTNGQRSQFYFVVVLYPITLLAMKHVLPSGWTTLTTTFQGRVALLGSMAMIVFATVWALSILNPKNLGGGNA
jgi:tight adherence protein B